MGSGYHSNMCAYKCWCALCFIDVHAESMGSQIDALETIAMGDVAVDTVSTDTVQLLCLNGCWETFTLLL